MYYFNVLYYKNELRLVILFQKKEIADEEMIKNLTTLIEKALDRAEKLKQSKEQNSNITGIL